MAVVGLGMGSAGVVQRGHQSVGHSATQTAAATCACKWHCPCGFRSGKAAPCIKAVVPLLLAASMKPEKVRIGGCGGLTEQSVPAVNACSGCRKVLHGQSRVMCAQTTHAS
jgi:hypothetical protein